MYIQGDPLYTHHVDTYGPDFGYKDFIPQFTADHFDPRVWAALFKRSGAQYAGPVAEHSDGFAMWNTSFSRFNAALMGPRRDTTGELIREIKATGLKSMASFHHMDVSLVSVDSPRVYLS